MNIVTAIAPSEEELSDDVAEQVEIQIKYEGYIEKSLQQVERVKKMENKKIPEDIDYDAIHRYCNGSTPKIEGSPSIIGRTSFTYFRSKSC